MNIYDLFAEGVFVYGVLGAIAILWVASLKAQKLTGHRLPHTEPHDHVKNVGA